MRTREDCLKLDADDPLALMAFTLKVAEVTPARFWKVTPVAPVPVLADVVVVPAPPFKT